MDKDCLRSLIKNVDSQLFEIVNNLICSICQELFSRPVTTPCGHSFCNGCIKRVLSSKDNSGCPLCKNPVKRYGLKGDEVKSTLREICREIPVAFASDVEELTNNFSDLGEDILMTSKLSQLFSNEFVKQSKISKQKSTANRKARVNNEKKKKETDSETFVPVLKRTKNVLEYASAKKKKMDDLVSISQTEPLSNSSLGDSELDKKLEKIEKILPEEKVSEWFNAVGDNIYINSPSSFLEIDSKNGDEGEKRDDEMATMFRRDYHKLCPQPGDRLPIDPYEFIPSQNNKPVRKRRKRKSTGKKIPDFKALQNFSRENVKRNNILTDESKEESCTADDSKDEPTEIQITASQKFDRLLSESNDQKKCHVLYTASPSSSIQFLDCSFHSKIETGRKKKTPRAKKKLPVNDDQLPVEDVLFKTIELFSGDKSLRTKRLRSTEGAARSGNKKRMMEVLEIKDASELKNSNESYLIEQKLETSTPSTKLGELLKELLDDDVIYETRPLNAPVRLPNVTFVNSVSEGQVDLSMQNTEMIGFCTQEETPYVKNFKKMVENMEKELISSEYLMELEREKEDYNLTEPLDSKTNSFVGEERNGGCDAAEETSKTSPVVEFLHLGRLTPIRRRAKSTVVKLVFPIGLTSLARRSAVQNKCTLLTPKKRTCHVSTGIQTSQQVVSSFVQTSQVPQISVDMQTSQQVGPSVEVQTTQKPTTSAEMQTSQRFVSQEIQTTQVESDFAEVQTTLVDRFCQNETATPCQTPVRKPSHQHRKIIQKNVSTETVPQSPKRPYTPEEQVARKDLIKDFHPERGLEKTLQSTLTQQLLTEFKNKRNTEKNKNSIVHKLEDIDSDDSDVQPPKRRVSFRILSQDSVRSSQDRQIPAEAGKLSQDEEMEIIDLGTPKSQTSEEQMLRVLKNIDLDLPKEKTAAVRGEKGEESDSDIFVEQTPPKHPRAVEDIKNVSKSRGKHSTVKENERTENSEGIDFICDSIPKGFSESFLLPTVPQRIPLTPEKNPNEFPRKISKIETAIPIELPDENDQNQLNAFDGKARAQEVDTKTAQLKAAVVAWKRTEASPPVKVAPPKKLCVVASSVKNPDMIRKFVNRFKLEYQNKPTKDLTHLIVGLHENDDGEMLPLCTPKLLFAMANKKWVVNESWVEMCLKANTILPEEEFETLDPVGGNGCRKARLSGEKILKNCEIFLLGEFQMISKEEFADLISDCGGIVVPTPEKFSFLPSKLRMIIADRDCLELNERQLQDLYQKHSAVILSRDVIIMSIQSFRLVNFSSYMLHSVAVESLIKLGYPSPLVRNEDEEEEEAEDSHRNAFR